MPVEFELEAYADREMTMPRFTGSVARGILLRLLGRVEPRLSQELHEPNIRKAYSVTPLIFRSRRRLQDG
ncbi:hypothetical protein KEJ36_05780, partial [Candidatus Bathyarchaeota archaeon]|nr:hypothetical protein [Candidatus Bathyarchaeota archaeon]